MRKIQDEILGGMPVRSGQGLGDEEITNSMPYRKSLMNSFLLMAYFFFGGRRVASITHEGYLLAVRRPRRNVDGALSSVHVRYYPGRSALGRHTA